MKVVALISGGKDSCMNIMMCKRHGHEIVALANLYPKDNEVDELDSHMFQTVGHHAISAYAACMGVPLLRRRIQGKSLQLGMEYDSKVGDEVEDLRILLRAVKQRFPDVQGVSCGAILSDYQRLRVEAVCASLGLTSLSFLWQRNQAELLKEMIDAGVEAVIVKVAAAGLDPETHLGMTISEVAPTLFSLEKKYGSHICGEGGEYETFVLDCPLFKARIVLEETKRVAHPSGDSTVGFLRIEAFHLEPKTGADAAAIGSSTNDIIEVEGTPEAAPPSPASKPGAVPVEVAVTKGTAVWNLEARVEPVETTTGGSDAACAQVFHALSAIKASLQAAGLAWTDALMVHLYLADMSHFAAVNGTYVRVVPLAAPPARACVQAVLPAGVLVAVDVSVRAPGQSAHKRACLHVQSVSGWAPACIGPYAQATRCMGAAFMAGQIGLDPAAMTLVGGGPGAEAPRCGESAAAVARCIRTPLETSALHCTIYGTDETALIAGAAAWDALLDSEGADDEDGEGGGGWRQRWRPPVAYVKVPALPRGASVEVEPVAAFPLDPFWGVDPEDAAPLDKVMGSMLRSDTVRPASVGLGGAQLRSAALHSPGLFCRSTAALVWPKGAGVPPPRAQEDDDDDAPSLADAVALGIVRALAANLHYAALGWGDAACVRVYVAEALLPSLALPQRELSAVEALREAFAEALASGGIFAPGGGAAGGSSKPATSAVIVPVLAVGTTPAADAGVLAEVVALRPAKPAAAAP